MSHGQGKPQNDQGNDREKSGILLRAHGWTRCCEFTIWGLWCQKWVIASCSKLWDVIIYSCLEYLFLQPQSSYIMTQNLSFASWYNGIITTATHASIYMEWNGDILDSPRCLAVSLAVRLKIRFPGLFEKNFGSIHFIPGIYPYWVSLLTPIHFHDPSIIFGPLVAKYLAENGVYGNFWKNCWLNSFHTWHLSLWGASLDPYTFSCS